MEDLGVGGPGRDGGGSSFRSRDLEVDPVTGEPVGTDWECKVVLAVMLADKPQPPAGAAGADSGLDGGS
jgi:hypothetical protein